MLHRYLVWCVRFRWPGGRTSSLFKDCDSLNFSDYNPNNSILLTFVAHRSHTHAHCARCGANIAPSFASHQHSRCAPPHTNGTLYLENGYIRLRQRRPSTFIRLISALASHGASQISFSVTVGTNQCTIGNCSYCCSTSSDIGDGRTNAEDNVQMYLTP